MTSRRQRPAQAAPRQTRPRGWPSAPRSPREARTRPRAGASPSTTRGRSSSTPSSPRGTWSSSGALGSQSSPGATASCPGDRTSRRGRSGPRAGASPQWRSQRCRIAGGHRRTRTPRASSCDSWAAWPSGTPSPARATLPSLSIGAASTSRRGRLKSRRLSCRAFATSASGTRTARSGSGCSLPCRRVSLRKREAARQSTRSAAGPPSSGPPASLPGFPSGCWTWASWGLAAGGIGQASWRHAP
mmetsp:Transcript_38436/g.119946  ORF Transcript_38436/g.119946 Transcript_38436/m.119946 type:complete len:244 (+) Transcript_38436:317-1048(+)